MELDRVGSLPPAPAASTAGQQPAKTLEGHYPDWVGAAGIEDYLKSAAHQASTSQPTVDFGMCFVNLQQADAHIRLAGAHTAAYRVLPGCKSTR
jgi:hypothetical protein